MISPARTSRWELPPRARRIPSTDVLGRVRDGTTSACAENTADDHTGIIAPGNYLRVRGEYRYLAITVGLPWELPPRARRIRDLFSTAGRLSGTTSACAENTNWIPPVNNSIRNYLRVRGEYKPRCSNSTVHVELPPRARRIPPPRAPKSGRSGTTSACAENT